MPPEQTVPPDAPIVVLGATGSIGTQTLDVARRLGLQVVGIAARRASTELATIAAEWPDAVVVAVDPGDDGSALTDRVGVRARFGEEALLELASTARAMVVNGIVGAAGLRASVAALNAGNHLALANKESLVAGGPVVMQALARGGGSLIPVDSEHSALAECLVGEDLGTVRRLVLTASGGPFRGMVRQQLADVSVGDALAHPTWAMGRRVTIDSATLMNKAFEVIEAHYLFGLPYDKIDVTVHPQSIVHSLVEFVDGSIKAQIGEPDMRHPIQYAITGGTRPAVPPSGFDLTQSDLTFEPPDRVTFPCLDLGYAAGRRGGIAPAALNAADEVAVAAFLAERIPFLSIADVVSATLEQTADVTPGSVDDVLAADAEARRIAERHVASVQHDA
ncbi:MAG: 1-deoxy-D-xylulose-5-phosphate reductoisomerase [Acidimicrobiia bacterium]|nr:1-deoxy-D-xylulose-5-phosphate reductoisomerase [Acidimicrobiia bacterium]